MADPAYRRLDVDERRRQLLERGAELFTSHRYDELSMSRIAAEVGISKSLLYHYFPSKQAFFEATLGAWAEEVDSSRIVMNMHLGDMPNWKVVKNMSLFAEQVVPQLRTGLAASRRPRVAVG